ncbi:MAG: site-specific integrase [Bacteroidota bacterium]|nr:site-specific integrase [Bacteroidota bacterium]
MLEKNFNLLFYLKCPKNYSAGPIPIYLRITINGSRTELTTSRSCDPEKWNSHAGRMTGTKEEAKSINAFLDTLQFKVFDVRNQALQSNNELTGQMVKNSLLGKKEKSKMILEVFQEHNDRFAELVDKEFAPLTLVRYKTSLEHTRSFILWKYQKPDMEVDQIDYDFVSSYSHYFKTVRNCNQNTAAKYLGNFRKIVIICLKQGWMTKNPFVDFKLPKKEVKREVLTMQEMEKLKNKVFEIERLSHIRDIFLFCCYTGLAYVDVQKLKPSDIKIGIDGEDWIFTFRQKTDIDTRIPLLPVARDLVEKYKNHPTCLVRGKVLPVPTNQRMNAYLKEVADLCEIKKVLTSHIARHTFATTVMLSNGVPIETVSKLLGHTNLRTTQHYAKILDGKISGDIQALKDKLAATEL